MSIRTARCLHGWKWFADCPECATEARARDYERRQNANQNIWPIWRFMTKEAAEEYLRDTVASLRIVHRCQCGNPTLEPSGVCFDCQFTMTWEGSRGQT